MSREIIDKFFDWLTFYTSKHGIKRFHIILHGGEPLLAGKEIIKYISHKSKANKNLKVTISLLTNGLLLNDQWLSLFTKLDIGFNISNSPILRKGVITSLEKEGAKFTYSDTSFDVEFSSEYKPALQMFLAGLETGLNFDGFVREFPDFSEYAAELLSTFDRYGFVTESVMPEPNQFISGTAFWKEIDTYTSRYLLSKQSLLAKVFEDEHVSRSILINYALQYYHFVKAGPQIIAAALSNADRPEVKAITEKFLVSELGHDKLLLKALAGAGIDSDKVKQTIPLPETFALISAYQVMADQEPLSFFACVFLVEEERPIFNERFVSACKRIGLNEAFYKPIMAHSHINEDEDHGAISEEILQYYTVISEETRIVVLKQLQNILDSMIALEQAIIQESDTCTDSIGWLN